MAEYYPLLAKAVASLPNSTPESRKVVYERARKALIGQLRTLHPPVPEEDIQRESIALDGAIQRLEAELAEASRNPSPTPAGGPPDAAAVVPSPGTPAPPRPAQPRFPATGGALGPAGRPPPPLRTKVPAPKPAASVLPDGTRPAIPAPVTAALNDPTPQAAPSERADANPPAQAPATAFVAPSDEMPARTRNEPQRPFAPQPPVPKGPRRPLWILPVGIGVVVLLVGIAAYKLRDKPDALVKAKAPEQQTSDTSKIAQRVGGSDSPAPAESSAPTPAADNEAQTTGAAAPAQETAQQNAPAPNNPPAAVAGRAALLVEAPGEANKVKTYLGTVVWRLDNVSDSQSQAVGLAVRADIDLPEDKMKVSVVFQKNTDASLPASHTVKIRFTVLPGSPSGGVKQINVPEMRSEGNPSGDPLDGVTVPIVENSFLIGLRPGNSETANLQLLRGREWIDIPMYLSSNKIAKLTFEKTAAGQRDLQEAIAAWSK